MVKAICKLCKEEQDIFLDGCCFICWDYMHKRYMRIMKESLVMAKIIIDD